MERAEQEAKDIKEGKPIQPKLVLGKMAHDSIWRSEFAFVTRNNQVICVPPGHPLYTKSKEEEERLNGPAITEDAELEGLLLNFKMN